MSLPTEDEEYQRLIESLHHAVEATTRISYLRGDQRWILVANGLEGTRRFVQALMAKRVTDSLGFKGPLQ